MTSEETIRQVFSDEAFVKTLFALETPEEVQSLLKEKKIELSIAEILKIRDLLLNTTEKDGMLSDEELQEVSGGLVIEASIIVGVVLSAGLMAGGGLLLGAGTAGFAWFFDEASGGKW